MQQSHMKRIARLLRRLIDPAVGIAFLGDIYAAFDAGPLRVCRLEERRVLAADPLEVRRISTMPSCATLKAASLR